MRSSFYWTSGLLPAGTGLFASYLYVELCRPGSPDALRRGGPRHSEAFRFYRFDPGKAVFGHFPGLQVSVHVRIRIKLAGLHEPMTNRDAHTPVRAEPPFDHRPGAANGSPFTITCGTSILTPLDVTLGFGAVLRVEKAGAENPRRSDAVTEPQLSEESQLKAPCHGQTHNITNLFQCQPPYTRDLRPGPLSRDIGNIPVSAADLPSL
jgi:hypothetical protein